MKLMISSAYLVLFSTAMFYTSCFDFSWKGISSWITGNKEETYLKEAYFDFDGTVILDNDYGSVLIKSWSLPKIAIEALKKAPEKEIESLTIDTQISNNKIVITTKENNKNNKYSVDYHLIVPYKANVVVKNKGSIKIKNVEGSIKAFSENTIDIRGAVGTLTGYTQGPISVAFSSLPLESLVKLTSTKNSITITLPSTAHVNLSAKTEFNTIISEHYVTLNPVTVLLNKQTWHRLQREVYGVIGNGGTSIFLNAYNGITIMR